jgi:hypothetical protein
VLRGEVEPETAYYGVKVFDVIRVPSSVQEGPVEGNGKCKDDDTAGRVDDS